jgi:hypothetical protein
MLLATLAIAGCMVSLGASSATAKSIFEAKGGKEGAVGLVPLRDDLTTPPSIGNDGTDLLASNTKAAWAWTIAGIVQEKQATSYISVGLELHSNPEAKNCSTAVGWCATNPAKVTI